MIRLTALIALISLAFACAPPSEGITRDEARAQSSKSDELDIDLCLEEGWYGDGEECDDFCLYPDPDCEGVDFCTDDSTCQEGEQCNAEELCLLSCDDTGACDLECAGFCVAAPTEEEVVCGGPAELACEAEQWCSYSGDSIYERAEVNGVCRDLPLLCPSILLPVCGRDGVTYTSECNANRAGVDAASDGPCDP